jgi:SAM-dependent methyltransferase
MRSDDKMPPMAAMWPSVGTSGVSEKLRLFVNEMPYERGPIFDFVRRAASRLAVGDFVVDVGAGDAPYRELFAHTSYKTLDWENSIHERASESDFVASADRIPLDDQCVDAVLLTQVLEHVSEPLSVLREVHRILNVGGALFLTAPLVWELHELPFDFYRYTDNGLMHLLRAAEFSHIELAPRNDAFATLAQLMRNVAVMCDRAAAIGTDPRQRTASSVLWRASEELSEFVGLDESNALPLGYSAVARRT